MNPQSGSSGTNLAPYATFAGAVIAAIALLIATAVTRHTAKQSLAQADSVATATAARAQAEAQAKRYQDAAGQLGHEKAAVRLAGVYAMARLADEWEDQRQTCVSVLCAYLRTSWPARDSQDWRDEREVRVSILSSIVARVKTESTSGWSALRFNLRSAVLPRATFTNCVFAKFVDMSSVTFTELFRMENVTFSNGMSIAHAKVQANVQIEDVTLENGALNLSAGEISVGGILRVSTSSLQRKVSRIVVQDMRCEGRFHVTFGASVEPQGWVKMERVIVGREGRVKIAQSSQGGKIEAGANLFPRLELLNWTALDHDSIILPSGADRGFLRIPS